MTAVHQFLDGASTGDAITNQALALRALLRAEGHASEVYARGVSPALAEDVRPFSHYRPSADQVLLIHFSFGIDEPAALLRLPDRLILVYHNITPEAFFAEPGLRRRARLGRAQLSPFALRADYALGASRYNRRELLAHGVTAAGVLPPVADLAAFRATAADPATMCARDGAVTWLFVGRVVPHKRADDLIRAFAHYQTHFQPHARLVLVGAVDGEAFPAALAELAGALGQGDRVVMTGKVSREVLKAHYASADVFVCLSEHEGFCVPVLEAMATDVPVIAFRAGGLPEVLGGAGILLDSQEPRVVSALVDVVLRDAGLRERLLARQRERVADFERLDLRGLLRDAIGRARAEHARPSLQVQGPCEGSDSLAIVNRGLAAALAATGRYDVSVRALADPRVAVAAYPHVAIRNHYPPHVADLDGQLNFLNFAWEESRVPSAHVVAFNRHLDGIGASSAFVRDALLASGVTIPVAVTGNGVALPEGFDALPPTPVATRKRFRFLHISSGFPRKGVDILLQGYFAAFDSDDDVVLIIKTFPNPHQRVAEQVAAARASHPRPPEVLLIERDLPEPQLFGLYKQASCYVHVARGEGFGLPVAEAMLARVPVLVSPNSGLADVCDETTAWLVPYRLVPAMSHVSVAGAMWAEPEAAALAATMKAIAGGAHADAVTRRVEAAEAAIRTRHSWEAVAARWLAFMARVRSLGLHAAGQAP